MTQEGRVPPSAVDVEMAVLGACLLEKEAIAIVVPILGDHDFYKPAHRTIYKRMVSLFERGIPIDLICLEDELKTNGELDRVDGVYYLTDLTTRVTSAANAEYHAHIVLEKSIARQGIALSAALQGRLFSETEDVLEVVGEAQDAIIALTGSTQKNKPRSLSKLAHPVLDEIEGLYSGKIKPQGLRSKFHDLNRLIGGYQPGGFYVYAGRPHAGKTAISTEDAVYLSLWEDIAYFSLEMTQKQLTYRIVTGECEIPTWKIQEGKITAFEMAKIAKKMADIAKLKLHICDQPALTVSEIAAHTKRLIVECNVKAVFIDYLQLMTHDKKASTRDEAIGRTTGALKALAKKHNIPVIVMSQLNRASVPEDGLKRPQLHHLRESGNIENDADVVVMVHRPQMYLDIMGKPTFLDGKEWSGIAEILVEKDRLRGGVGNFDLRYVKDFAKFENLSKVDPPKEIQDIGELLYLQGEKKEPNREPEPDLPF